MSAEFNKQALDVISYLKTLSPSGIELEFMSLASFEFDDTVKGRGEKLINPTELVSPISSLFTLFSIPLYYYFFANNFLFQIKRMLSVLIHALGTCSDFDFVQALLNNFLKNHSDAIIEEEELSDMLALVNDK